MATVRFDGETGSPELNRITAKKNYASSMQSHKMGATYMFDALHKYMGEEMYPDLRNEVEGHVAVKQLPVYAFEKTLVEGTTDQYNHTYIGNFTVGADKGDNNWFGLTDERVKDTAIRLEGTDHIKGVGFNYPWEVNGVKTIRYNADKEALCIVTGSDATTWSAILEQSYCGTAETEAEIEAYLEQEFKPAYECAYRANPLLVGVTQTLAEINADVEAFKKLRRNDGRPYSYCEFWIDGEYDLYYLNLERNQYEKNGVNLYDELSDNEKAIVDAADTLEQKNQVFINFRINRFKEEAPNYWHINDGLFQLAFLLSIGASDNLEKNMYPYKLTPLSEGGRWRFFQDDLDSIKATDNQGQDTKSYSVELHDFTDDTQSAYVFKGEDNAYFQALERAFPERLQKMGKDMLQAMYDLSPKGTKTLDKLMGFFDEFFFSRAQDYFTKSAYNNDAEYSYEEAWNNKEYVASVDINPLAQSMGDHYTTERAWVEKRMIYLMSKYGFGGFASYEDSGLGIISVRTQDPQGFTLTPAIDSYPTILGGQAQTSRAIERIKAGEAISLAAVGGGNTNTYIVGADWLSDIGDLKDLSIDPSSVVVLSVASKRLRRLKVGDENAEEVTSYLATLSVQQCDSMETVDARNLTTLVGTVDLSKCPRLLEALFGGTNVTGVIIAAGSKVEHVQIPDSVTAIDLRNTKFLETFEYGTLANLGFLRLENVPTIDAFAVLKEAYNSDGSQLKDIRLVGFNYNGDARDLDMISNLASDKDKDGNDHPYNGIDADGTPTTGNPVLEGKLNIDGCVYEDTANVVQQLYPTIEFTPKGYYVRFADAEVQRIVAENWGDGIGTTTEQIEAITDIGTTFKGNTAIETFDEFEKFTGVAKISSNQNNQTYTPFEGCANLKSIKLPNGLTTIGYYSFYNCNNLTDVSFVDSITHIYGGSFMGTMLQGEVVLPNAIYIDGFSGTNIEKFTADIIASFVSSVFYNCLNLKGVSFASLKTIPNANNYNQGVFQGCSSLTHINIPNITNIGSKAFYGCTSLEIDELSLPNLETLGQNAFYGVKIKKISNLGKLTALPTASSSTQNFGDKSVLEEVVLPGTLSEISKDCFNGYTALVTCVIPSSVKIIGDAAFYKTPVVFDSNSLVHIETLGNMAFGNTTNITILNAPNLKTIGYGLFYQSGLERIENLGVVSEIPDRANSTNAFGDCTKLVYVELPSSLTKIGNYAFQLCTALETFICNAITPPTLGAGAIESTNNCPIYVPDASVEAYKTATNWSAYADRIMSMFYYLGYIDFVDPAVRDICVANFDTDGDGVISMEEAAAVTDIGALFEGNTSITSFDEFKYFTGVTKLNAHTFLNCTNLTIITLPDSITSITAWSGVFQNTKLEAINVPSNCNITSDQFKSATLKRITFMGKGYMNGVAFSYCPNVEELVINKNNSHLKTKDGCLYSADGATFYGMINSRTTNPDLEGVTTLVNGSLAYANVTESITLPDSVVTTDNDGQTFKNAKYKKVEIKGLTKIKQSDFTDMPNLECVVLHKVKSIDHSVFTNSNKIKALVILTDSVCSISSSSRLVSTAFIYVPDNLVEDYKVAANWSAYANQIKPINVADTLPNIGSVAENDLYKVGEVYWKAEMVDSVLTWVEI